MIRPPPPLQNHLVGRRLDAQERPLQVDGHDLLELGQGELGDGVLGLDAGVVDKNIQASELRHRLRDQRRDLVRLGHVGLHGQRLAPSGGDLPHGVVARARLADVVDHDRCALARHRDGHGLPNARRRAGDNSDLVFQPHRVSLPGKNALGQEIPASRLRLTPGLVLCIMLACVFKESKLPRSSCRRRSDRGSPDSMPTRGMRRPKPTRRQASWTPWRRRR